MFKNLTLLKSLKIRQRLILGFSSIVMLLVIAVGATTFEVDRIAGGMTRIVELRVPTANASASLVNSINASLAALRGWMLTGNAAFKDQRAGVWDNIVETSASIDELSQHWTNPDNVAKWNEFKVTLAEFKTAQQSVEAIAHSNKQYPATVILVEDAAPKAAIIVTEITNMINEEQTLDATTARKNLLGTMADVRGTMGLALANIRAFLLTGDEKFADKFKQLWTTNSKRFKDLSGLIADMTASQKASYDKMSKARTGFKDLPPKMFEIAKSKQANMANFTLVSEAAPRAAKLLNILEGERNSKGSRVGGMVYNQKMLLENDAEGLLDEITILEIIEFVILGIALISSAVVVTLTSRSIVTPINSMSAAMGKLAEGDVSIDVPALDRVDEIGDMAKAVQIFKDNKIKADELAEDQRRMAAEMEEAEEAKRVRQQERTDAEAVQIAERERRAANVDSLTKGFDTEVGAIMKSVLTALQSLEGTAGELSESADKSSRQAGTVAAASEQAANNVQTVAAATEELTTSVNEISQRVNDSESIANAAVTEASKTNEKISELNRTAQKVNEVVSLISDIAEQTNLLALNATIEAARAGDAGKGFAVVASEVKNLATQTAKATQDIAGQISAMQNNTTEAVDAVGGITKTIDRINEITVSISAAVEEQSSATQEISRNIQEATVGNQEVAKHIVDVSEAAGETAQASAQTLKISKSVIAQS
ncbi:MAG: methyl-accepting chemotaxis protein, partial [Sneathiella sp.]